MIRGLAFVTMVFGLGATVSAHDMKILTNRASLPDGGGKATVYLSWGHRLPVDDLIDGSTLLRYELLSPGIPATALKKDDLSLQANSIVLKDAGLHTVVATRKPSINTYILDDAGQKRFQRGPKSAHAGKKIDHAVRSNQSAKTLLQVGEPGQIAPAPLGLVAEIVPLDAPAKWVAGGELRLRVLHDGKPLPNATVTARPVRFESEDADELTTQTSTAGDAVIRAKHPGLWLFRVQHKIPAAETVRAEFDFESFTTTLTLEVRP